jgi:Phage derived protein Gp49-like (DUF891)
VRVNNRSRKIGKKRSRRRPALKLGPGPALVPRGRPDADAERRTRQRSALDSNRIARVIFCMGDGCMILLHGFIKKTQKTPQADIDLALKRKREVT